MPHKIGPDANGTVIEMRVGEELQTELGENPTTGYKWRVEPVAGDAVVLASSSYSPGGRNVGIGGKRVFTFRAARPGTAILSMTRTRGTQVAAADADDRFGVTVRVSEATGL